MNERIKQLYVEATGKDWAYDFDPEVAEKFAELIVQECVDYAFHSGDDVSYLFKHFGVEE
jgi:hypothetical protein